MKEGFVVSRGVSVGPKTKLGMYMSEKNIEFRIHCMYLRKNKEWCQGCGGGGKRRGSIELDVWTTLRVFMEVGHFFMRLKITKLMFKMKIFQNEEFLDNNKGVLSKRSQKKGLNLF